MKEIDDAIGMLKALMATVQGMDFYLAPIVEKLEAYRNKNRVVEVGSIDGTATRVS